MKCQMQSWHNIVINSYDINVEHAAKYGACHAPKA